MKRVLFVDDEVNVLNGLKRMLRHMKDDWQMEFFSNGEDVLASISETPCDVLVSDMKMPGMDGVALLAAVRKNCPQTIRIALSGQSDTSMIYRCISHAHQYLSKPCAADVLVETIDRACDLQQILSDARLKKLISRLTSIPSTPEAYEKIMHELQTGTSGMSAVGKIVESDAAMSLKILQLVNSAFFGLPRYISSPAEATVYLGVDVIKNLVLANGVFSQFDPAAIESHELNEVWNRSAHICKLARAIVLHHTDDHVLADYTSAAGLLIDIGTLALAAELPEEMTTVRRICEKQCRDDWQVEREVLAHSHMEVGAFLAALWGLPSPIVEAIAFHHEPMRCKSTSFTSLTAVHIANAIVRATETEDLPQLNTDYIELLGLSDHIPRWRDLYINPVIGEDR